VSFSRSSRISSTAEASTARGEVFGGRDRGSSRPKGRGHALTQTIRHSRLDAGADTIGWHLAHHHATTLSRATINRILVRAGAVTPDPSKRPKSSYIRFEADQPNETWQSDFTH
jgi:hypothetical protein